MANVSTRPILSRRAFVRRLGGTALLSALGAHLLAACNQPISPGSAPTSAPPVAATAPPPATSAPAPAKPTAASGAAPPTTAPAAGGAVVSRSGSVTLPAYVAAADVPPPDVPGGTITPPGYTKYPAQL